VAEVILRLFGYASFVDFKPDARLMWLPVPGHRLTVVRRKPITVSSDQFRYPENLGPKAPGEVRIFSFGDSVTMGWGVDDHSHYSAVLERLLNTNCKGKHYRVISAGVNAYPNDLVQERLQIVVQGRYQPDVAVLAYSFNTAMEGLPLLKGAARQRVLDRVALKSAFRKIALYDFLVEGVLRNVVYYRLRDAFIQGSWDTTQEHAAALVQSFKDGVLRCNRECNEYHVKLVLLLLASRDQKDRLFPEQQTMLDLAAEYQIPLVNMIQVFHDQDHSRLYMDHVHPNEAGHEQIAAQLKGLLLNTGVCTP
jgi:lysophospholipase L1-like esterase